MKNLNLKKKQSRIIFWIGELIIDKSSLIKRLKENDPLVKFVPFGYKIGKQTWQELEKNLYIIARYGGEGVEKIAKVALKYTGNSYIWSFNSVDKEKVRMSALYRSEDFVGRLNIDGDDQYGDNWGHAFGVCPEKK